MNAVLQDQLMKLKMSHFEVDGKAVKDIPEDFNEIVFKKKSKIVGDNIKVIFENYIIHPFEGFDFHDKWNKGIPPYAKVMYGKIVEETKGMYKLEVHSETDSTIWLGWCPKKSCSIKEI